MKLFFVYRERPFLNLHSFMHGHSDDANFTYLNKLKKALLF